MKTGIISTSEIVPNFINSLKDYPDVEFTFIYSRSYEKGLAMAQKIGVPKVCTDFEEALADPDTDTVYIVTPNSLHYPQARMALLAGKNVIVEKPFCASLNQAKELFEIADEKNLRIFEMAISRGMDRYEFIRQHIDQLGPIHLYKDNHSQYSRRYDAFRNGTVLNVFNPLMEGGALMDLNVYNIAVMTMLFGKPEEVNYIANLEKGIDTAGELIVKYPGLICELSSSKNSASQNILLIQGEKGSLRINKFPAENGYDCFLQLNGQPAVKTVVPAKGQNMERIVRCLNQKDDSVYEREKQIILTMVDILEKARKSCGMIFPSDRA